MILLGTGREDTPGKTLDTKELEDSKAFIASRHGSNCGKKTMDLSAFFFFPLLVWGLEGASFLCVFFLSFFLPPLFTAGFLFLSSIAFRFFFVLMNSFDSLSRQRKRVNEGISWIRRLAVFYRHVFVSLSDQLPAPYLDRSRLRTHCT